MNQFSGQFMKSPENVDRKTPNPNVGWGLKTIIDFLGSLCHFPNFLFFYPLKSPLGLTFFLGSNNSQINPHTYACQIGLQCDGRVEGGGGGTDIHHSGVCVWVYKFQVYSSPFLIYSIVLHVSLYILF